MSSERDRRGNRFDPKERRDAHALVPGKHANTDVLAGASQPHTKVPGRRSLTESIPAAILPEHESATVPGTARMGSAEAGTDTNHHFMPVQRRADAAGAVSSEKAHLAAKSGLAQATRPLPHVATIQRAFGRHDVSDIKTNVGGEAATASKSIFARAFTQGTRIAFAADPDLHTAAHEAAHVVQQRAGHAPPAGVDTPGDSLERHADDVADAVVAGRSAEPLLDAYAGARVGSSDQAVQRKSDGAAQESPHAKLEQYLNPNSNRVWRAIGQHMLGMEFPQPHARLHWVNQHAFTVRMLKQLESSMDDFKPLTKFDELLHPTSAMKVVGALVSPGGPWSPQVGISIAHELYLAIWASLKRLALRYLEVADSRGVSGEDGVTSDLLIASMPIDRYIAVALCDKHSVTVEPLGAKDANAAKGKSVALRPVTLKWEGDRDTKLWNWVRAEPADATAEEVAAKLWVVTDNHGDKSASFNAYLLATAPPLFGVPKRFALQNPHMAKHAPWNALAPGDSVEHQLLDVAVSSARDDVALGSVGATDPNEAPAVKGVVLDNLRDCKDQLDFIQLKLRPWNLADRASPAQGFIQTKAANLSTLDVKELTNWAHVIEGQKARLVRISGAVRTLDDATQKLGIKSPKGEQAAPLREILELLGVAAGVSYIARASEGKLNEALQLQVALSVRAVQANERNMVSAVDGIREQIGDNHRTGEIYDQSTDLRHRSRALQLQILGGEAIDQDEMDDVSLRTEEVALDAKVLGTLDALAELNKAAHDAGEGDAAIIASLFSGKYRNLPSLTKHVFDELSPIRNNNPVRKGFDEEEKAHPSPARHRQNQEDRRRQLVHGQARFSKIAADRDLQHFFKNAVETIKNQQFRTACVKVAAMIGVSVMAGSVAGLAARAVGGMLMEASGAATLQELSLVARATKGAIGIGVDTTISAAGTSAIEGTSFTEVWKENLIINLASSAVFGSFAKYAQEQAELEARLGKTAAKATKLGKVGKLLKEVGAISVHTIWGAAMGEVAGRLVTGQAQPAAATLQE